MSRVTTDYDYDYDDDSPEAILARGGLVSPQQWQLLSLCSQTDPEVFFPERGGYTSAAKNVCRKCPVRKLCLDWALTNNERFGIAGGKSERERRALGQTTAGRAEVRLAALRQSAEFRTQSAAYARTPSVVICDAKPAAARTLHAVPNITPATSPPKEMELMKDKDRFPTIIAFLQQVPGQTMSIHRSKRSSADHPFMQAAHVKTMSDLYRVVGRLGREVPYVKVVEDQDKITITLGALDARKPADPVVSSTPNVFPVSTRFEKPKVSVPKPQPPVESDETDLTEYALLDEIIDASEHIAEELELAIGNDGHETAPLEETPQLVGVIPTDSEARTLKPVPVADPEDVLKPRTLRSRPEPTAKATVPVKRPPLALVKPPDANHQQRALDNYQDLAANAPNDSARSYWQAKVDELLGVSMPEANTA